MPFDLAKYYASHRLLVATGFHMMNAHYRCFEVSESLYLGLALYIGFRSYGWRIHNISNNSEALTDVLLRDSILYFLVIFFTDLTATFFWIKSDVSGPSHLHSYQTDPSHIRSCIFNP